MSTIILTKPANGPDTVNTDPCITLTTPTQFILTGNGTAVITFQGTKIATLRPSKPTYKIFVEGDYCVTLTALCNEAAVLIDELVGVRSELDTERNEVGCTVDESGSADGKVYLTTVYDEDGNPTGEQLIRIGFDGVITRPYVGPITSCSSGGSTVFYEEIVNITGGDADEECVAVTAVNVDGVLRYYRSGSATPITAPEVVTPTTSLDECCAPIDQPIAVDDGPLGVPGSGFADQDILANDSAVLPATIDPTTVEFNLTGASSGVVLSGGNKIATNSGGSTLTIDPVSGLVTYVAIGGSDALWTVGYTFRDSLGIQSNVAVVSARVVIV